MRSDRPRASFGALGALAALLLAPLASAGAPLAQEPGADALGGIVRLLNEGRHAEAEAQLRVLIDAGPNARAKYLLAVCLVERYEYAGAEELLGEATAEEPDRVDWLFLLAKVQQERGKYVAALDTLDACLALQPAAEYRFWKGLCAQRAGRIEEAERELRLTLKKRPKHAEALYRLGCLLGDRGEFEKSREMLARCLEVRPGHVDARFRLGVAEDESGEHEAALATFDAVLSEVPSHLGALYNRGRVLLALGRRDEGRECLERFRAMGVLADEIQHLLGLLKNAPADVPLRREVVRRMLEAGKLEEAAQQLALGRSFAPEDAELERLTAQLERLQGDADAASAAEERARRKQLGRDQRLAEER